MDRLLWVSYFETIAVSRLLELCDGRYKLLIIDCERIAMSYDFKKNNCEKKFSRRDGP